MAIQAPVAEEEYMKHMLKPLLLFLQASSQAIFLNTGTCDRLWYESSPSLFFGIASGVLKEHLCLKYLLSPVSLQSLTFTQVSGWCLVMIS